MFVISLPSPKKTPASIKKSKNIFFSQVNITPLRVLPFRSILISHLRSNCFYPFLSAIKNFYFHPQFWLNFAQSRQQLNISGFNFWLIGKKKSNNKIILLYFFIIKMNRVIIGNYLIKVMQTVLTRMSFVYSHNPFDAN